MTMTQPSIFAYFACCPLWGRRCPPTPESYWKKRALKQYTKFFSPNGMAQHALATGFQESIYQWYTAWYISLGLWVSHWLPHHLPWTNHHHPWHPKGKKKAKSMPQKWEALWIWSDVCKILQASCFKKTGLRGWVVLRNINKVSGLHSEGFWFLDMFSAFRCPRNGETLARRPLWGLGPAPGENQWSRVAGSQKTQTDRVVESQGGTWRCWKAMLEYEGRWFDDI